jgi:hypothetical protein
MSHSTAKPLVIGMASDSQAKTPIPCSSGLLGKPTRSRDFMRLLSKARDKAQVHDVKHAGVTQNDMLRMLQDSLAAGKNGQYLPDDFLFEPQVSRTSEWTASAARTQQASTRPS